MQAVIYARYSSDNQREESIDAQIRAIKDFAQHNGYTIIREYIDEALSAKTDNRPQFLQMISDSKNRQFEAVICHKLDRFARNRYDSAFYKRILKENGVKLVSVLENFDDSPESIILESVLEGMAEYYSANLAREVKKGLKENALDCKHTGGKPPFGYDVDNTKHYIINEEEASAVKEIFERVNRKETIGSIVKWLNSNGHRTKYGTLFSSSSINTIIRNEKYKGTYIYGKNKRIKENGITKDLPGNDVIRIENGIPRIVTDELWIAANKIYDKRVHVAGGQSKSKEVYLLSGLIKCGLCGGSMCGNKVRSGRNKDIRITYQCNTRKTKKTCNAKEIRKDLVEEVVLSTLEKVLAEDSINKILDFIESRYSEQKREIPSLLKQSRTELTKIDSQLNNVLDLVMNGYNTPTVLEKIKILEVKKQDLASRISYYENLESEKSINRTYAYNYLKQYSSVKAKSLEMQRKAINVFVRKVTVFPDKIEVQTDVDTGDRPSAPSLRSSKNTYSTDIYWYYTCFYFSCIINIFLELYNNFVIIQHEIQLEFLNKSTFDVLTVHFLDTRYYIIIFI